MLRRRWLINLALFGIALALALVARLDQDRAGLASRLTALAATDIEHLTLLRPGQPTVRLQRQGDDWHMTEPFPALADATLIDKLLPITSATVHRTLPAAALDLPQVGLEPALIRLQLDDLELRFGRTEPIANQRYVQIGDMVHLIDDRHLPQLLATAADYASKRLLPTGFSPGLARIDGRPLGAGAVAGLVDAEAERVEPLTGQLSGRVLTLESADAGPGLRFLIDDGGTRWSRLDQRLSYVFTARRWLRPTKTGEPSNQSRNHSRPGTTTPSKPQPIRNCCNCNRRPTRAQTQRGFRRQMRDTDNPGPVPGPMTEPRELLPPSRDTDMPLPTQKLTP